MASRNQREGRFAGRANRQTRRQFDLATGYTRVHPGVVLEYLSHGWVGPGDTCAWWALVLRDARRADAAQDGQDAVAIALVAKLTGFPEAFIRERLAG